MARSDRRAIFRARVYPVLESWIPAPGREESVVRFLIRASVFMPEAGDYHLASGLLAPEIPTSILPFGLRDAVDSEVRPAGEAWRSRPAPSWRGIPCRPVTVSMRVPNELSPDEPMTFPLLALLPDHDPPGPRLQHILLGAEFFRHYNLRMLVSYPAIRYLDTRGVDRRGVDTGIPCGYLEKA